MTETPYRPPWWTTWKVTPRLVEEFIHLKEEGFSNYAIARKFGVVESTVRYWLNLDYRRKILSRSGSLEKLNRLKKEHPELFRENTRELRCKRRRFDPRYRESQKLASKKYIEKLRRTYPEKFKRVYWGDIQRKYQRFRHKMETDPEYREMVRKREAERYKRKKEDRDWYKRRLRKQAERYKRKWREDQEWRERRKAYNREHYKRGKDLVREV